MITCRKHHGAVGAKVLVPLLLGGTAIAATIIMSYPRLRQTGVENKIRQANEDKQAIMQAFLGWEIDVKIPLPPLADNKFPTMLTTPIAYLTSIPADPFSSNGEPYRFITTPRGHYNQTFIVVSQGPDEDWDIAGATNKTEIYGDIELPAETASVKVSMPGRDSYTQRINSPGDNEWLRSTRYVEEYTLNDGTVVSGRKLSLALLPIVTSDKTRYHTMAEVDASLIHMRIPSYDPTNGTFSNGDLMMVVDAVGGEGTNTK